MVPMSLAHQLILTHAPVRDTWMVLHPDCSLGSATYVKEKARGKPVPTASYNLLENGATCDNVINTWRWKPSERKRIGPGKPDIDIPLETPDPEANRLDYIFASTAFDQSKPDQGGWIVRSAQVGMLDRHPTLKCSLSDHFSVEVTLAHSSTLDKAADSALEKGTFLEAQSINSDPDKELASQLDFSSPAYLPAQTYNDILHVLQVYKQRQLKQRSIRMGHFLGSVGASIACLIGVWWVPHNFVSFILALFSTLNLAAGVLNGLIGGLFITSELRALKEFDWEIRNVRAAAGGEPHTTIDGVTEL